VIDHSGVKKKENRAVFVSADRESLAPRLNPVPIIGMYFGGAVFA
jgi:hypothetical protein